jgi:hypothetical protein
MGKRKKVSSRNSGLRLAALAAFAGCLACGYAGYKLTGAFLFAASILLGMLGVSGKENDPDSESDEPDDDSDSSF